jgi:hypothetical protein
MIKQKSISNTPVTLHLVLRVRQGEEGEEEVVKKDGEEELSKGCVNSSAANELCIHPKLRADIYT